MKRTVTAAPTSLQAVKSRVLGIPRLFTVAIGLIGALALSVAFVSAAAAQVTPPENTISNFHETGGTFTFNGFNGGSSNVAVVVPGSANSASSTLTLPNLKNGSVYTAPVGIVGFSSPFNGCPNVEGYGGTSTVTSSFTAPGTAGIYNITADLGPNFTCQGSWHSTTTGPVVAILVVTSFESVCALAHSYSTDPGVADGLCDKLAAAQRAADRGETKAQANILRAFDNQVSAQTGKALTEEQANTLTTLVYYLEP
jgi:hypothetical protein